MIGGKYVTVYNSSYYTNGCNCFMNAKLELKVHYNLGRMKVVMKI